MVRVSVETEVTISSPDVPTPRSVEVAECTFVDNSGDGIFANGCTVHIATTTFDGNANGVELYNGGGAIDRCNFASSGGVDAQVDDVSVTNSFFSHSQIGMIWTVVSKPAAPFEFNTVVDNGIGIACNGLNAPTLENNIIARNSMEETRADGSGCTYPGSIIVDDLAALRFKSPDVYPFDYHLMAGSTAIDAATSSTIDHDYDGSERPMGLGRDIGADEAM